MLTGRNIVCVSTIDWDFLWQEHQALTSLFAKAGNRVLFIENTGIRTPGWKDRGRVLARLRKWADGRGRFQPVMENVTLYSPLALPFPYSPLAQRLNRMWVLGTIRRWLAKNGFRDLIVLSFLPTQFLLDLIDEVDPAVSIFYCTDKLSQTSDAARPLVAYEQRVLRRCDLVFASSRRLVEYCRQENSAAELLSIGVSLGKFDAAWRNPPPEPVDLSPLPRPRIGLIGGLRACVDQSLLGDVARRLANCSFVLVGPEQVPFDGLKTLVNVHLLGPRPHDRIPDYLSHLDACIIPYVVDDFTDHISPAKLNEYLALGKPVVSTPLQEVRRYVVDHGDVVAIASGADGFAAAIDRALLDDSPMERARRRAVAERNSWEVKVETMSRRIEQKLTARATEPVVRARG
jgi:glycosyltransferase involved in cell wall biosynthesis